MFLFIKILKNIIMISFIVLLFTCSSHSSKINITLWQQMEPTALRVFKEITEEFMSENPQINVELVYYGNEDLRTAFQNTAISGEGPDLFYGPNDNIGLFVEADLLMKIDNFFNEDFLSKFTKESLSENYYKGSLYALPDIHGNHIALVYNKALVEREPKTFEELIEMAKSIRREDAKNVENNIYGFAYFEREPYYFIGFFNGFGGRVLNDLKEPNLNSPAMREALSFARDIRQKYNLGFPGMLHDNVHELFKQGKIAFILNGAWSWQEYKNAGLDIAVIPVPKVKGKRPLFYSSTKGFSIPKNLKDEKREALSLYLKFIFRPENNAKYALSQAQVPTIIEALEYESVAKDELLIASREVLKQTIAMPIDIEMRAIWDAMREVLESVILGNMGIDEGIDKMQKNARLGILMLKGEQ